MTFATGLDVETSTKMAAEREQNRRFTEMKKQIDALAQGMSVQFGILSRARAYKPRNATEARTMRAQAQTARQGVLEAYRQLGLLFKAAIEFDDTLQIERQ